MSLTLKIQMVRLNQQKSMKFAPTMSVSEVIGQIKEKTNEGGDDHGLFQPGLEGKRPSRWLRLDRTLQYYDLKMNDLLEYKKKHRPLKVKLMDDTVKTVLVDDSLSVGEIVELIGKKMQIKNFEEFSLQRDTSAAAPTGKESKDTVPTSELWLTSTQTLHEQGVADEDMVVLKKKFFVEDDKVSRDDPVQLHLVYVQSRDAIVSGSHPCQLDESLQFAALQCQVQLGNYNAAVHKPGFLKLKEYVPPPILNKYKGPSLEKDLYNEHKKLVGMSEVNAKYRYVQLCRSLKTYGITFFHTKERVKGQKKPVAKMLGITRDAIIRLDFESKEVEHEYPLTHLKRWAASPASFTLDFGDYEDDYVSVITTEGEAISQLLAGYIDILLKKRKDTGVVLDENDNDVATVETVGRVRGQAGTAISTSSVAGYDSSQGRVGDLGFGGQPMARKGDRPKNDVTVTDIGSAQTAVANILNEMENPGLPVPGSMSSLTPQQWRQQLLTNANGVASAAGKLVGALSGPGQLDRNTLNNCAKEVTLSVDQMAAAVRGASLAEGKDPDGEMPLFDGAKQVADAVAKLLKESKDASLNPSNPQAKEALRTAQEALKNAGTFLAGACNSLLADSGTHKLLLEFAKLITASTNGMCNMAEQSANIQDPGNRQQAQTTAKLANQPGLHNLTVTEVLAPAVLDPSCKRQIVESAKAVQSANAFLLASAKSAGMDANAMDCMQEMARAVADAIGQLLSGTEMAEPRGGTDPEFAEAAKAISNAAATLIRAQGNPALIQSAAGTVKTCEPGLIAGAKRAAGKADDDAVKQRILQMAKQVAEAVKSLTDVAGNATANPSIQAAFQRLQALARKLVALTSQLVGDAGKQAAMQQLRSNSKFAAAAATGLVAAARNAATASNDQTEQANLLDAAKGVAEAVNALMASLVHAQRHPDDPAAQQALMDAARKMAPGAYKLVAQAKSVAPSVVDPGKMQDMLLALGAAADAIKDLLNSNTGASSAFGEQEFNEASKQFQAVMADLDATQMFAQNGQMEALPSQTKDGAIDLLNTAVRGMGNAAKALVGAAKTNPDQLGPRAKDVASSVRQVVTAAKALAGSTNNRTTQKAILGGARELANASEAMVSCAHSIASNPHDPALAHALTNAAKVVANALAKLIAQSKGADPGAKEAEEAFQALQRDAMRINTVPINLGGDFNGNSEHLLQSTKAINATIAQLLHAARNNPNGLGSAAKTTSATIPELIDAANAAAGLCPVKNVQDQIVNSTGTQKEINDALAQVQAALVRLQTGELANMPPNILDALSQAAKSMAEKTAGVLTSCHNPEKLAAVAKKVANLLDRVVDNSKATAAMASGQSSEGLEPLAKKLMDSCAALVNASNTPSLDAHAKKNIIGNAKNAAMATSSLVSAAKATADTLKDNDLERSRAMLNHAQNVANATAKLVNLSKNAAACQPSPKVETTKAQKDMVNAVDHLLDSSHGISTVPSLDLGLLSPAAEALLGAARAIVHTTNKLLDVAKPVVQGSKDPSSMNAMSNAVKSVTGGIQALMTAANGLKPGQKELNEAIEVIQATSVDLDSAALNATIGSPGNSAPPGKTAPKCQEEIMESSKELATAVKEVITAAKSAPENLGKAAKHTSDVVPRLATAAKQADGLLRDNTQQQEQLASAKNVTDGVLELMCAAKEGNMNNIAQAAQAASLAINGLLTALKPSMAGSAASEEALAMVKNALANLGGPPQPQGRQRTQECRDKLTEICRSLAKGISTLLTTSKTKPEDVGAMSKKIATMIPGLVEMTRLAAAAMSEAASKKRLLDSTKDIANATAKIFARVKDAGADPKNAAVQQKTSGAVNAGTAAIARFVNALKAGAVGDREAAIDEMACMAADMDVASLCAAAGQLDPNIEAISQTIEGLQAVLVQAAKGIASSSAGVVAATKGTSEQLGTASEQLAAGLTRLSKLSKATASLVGDSLSQQNILSGARAVCLTCQNMVVSARTAQKSPGDQTAQTALQGSFASVAEALKSFIENAQATTFETPAFKDNMKITVDDVIASARALAESSAQLVTAAKKVANSLDRVFDNSKAAAAMASGQSSEGLEPLAKKLMDSCAALVNASNTPSLNAFNSHQDLVDVCNDCTPTSVSASMLQLVVCSVQWMTRLLWISSHASMEQLLELVARTYMVPRRLIRLKYKGRLLDGPSHLWSAGITHNSYIHVMMGGLCGGGRSRNQARQEAGAASSISSTTSTPSSSSSSSSSHTHPPITPTSTPSAVGPVDLSSRHHSNTNKSSPLELEPITNRGTNTPKSIKKKKVIPIEPQDQVIFHPHPPIKGNELSSLTSAFDKWVRWSSSLCEFLRATCSLDSHIRARQDIFAALGVRQFPVARGVPIFSSATPSIDLLPLHSSTSTSTSISPLSSVSISASTSSPPVMYTASLDVIYYSFNTQEQRTSWRTDTIDVSLRPFDTSSLEIRKAEGGPGSPLTERNRYSLLVTLLMFQAFQGIPESSLPPPDLSPAVRVRMWLSWSMKPSQSCFKEMVHVCRCDDRLVLGANNTWHSGPADCEATADYMCIPDREGLIPAAEAAQVADGGVSFDGTDLYDLLEEGSGDEVDPNGKGKSRGGKGKATGRSSSLAALAGTKKWPLGTVSLCAVCQRPGGILYHVLYPKRDIPLCVACSGQQTKLSDGTCAPSLAYLKQRFLATEWCAWCSNVNVKGSNTNLYIAEDCHRHVVTPSTSTTYTLPPSSTSSASSSSSRPSPSPTNGVPAHGYCLACVERLHGSEVATLVQAPNSYPLKCVVCEPDHKDFEVFLAGVRSPHPCNVEITFDPDGWAERTKDLLKQRLPANIDRRYVAQNFPVHPNGELWLNDSQIEALNFLIQCLRNGHGALLGDPMGEGKTAVVVALLAVIIRCLGVIEAPFRIVAPQLAKTAWVDALSTLSRLLPHANLAGGKEDDERLYIYYQVIAGKQVPLALITTYEVSRAKLDRRLWSHFYFLLDILDEAHRIKHPGSLTSIAKREQSALFSLCVSGTFGHHRLGDIYHPLYLAHPAHYGDSLIMLEFAQLCDDLHRAYKDCRSARIPEIRSRAEEDLTVAQGRMRQFISPVYTRCRIDGHREYPPPLRWHIAIPPTEAQARVFGLVGLRRNQIRQVENISHPSVSSIPRKKTKLSTSSTQQHHTHPSSAAHHLPLPMSPTPLHTSDSIVAAAPVGSSLHPASNQDPAEDMNIDVDADADAAATVADDDNNDDNDADNADLHTFPDESDIDDNNDDSSDTDMDSSDSDFTLDLDSDMEDEYDDDDVDEDDTSSDSAGSDVHLDSDTLEDTAIPIHGCMADGPSLHLPAQQPILRRDKRTVDHITVSDPSNPEVLHHIPLESDIMRDPKAFISSFTGEQLLVFSPKCRYLLFYIIDALSQRESVVITSDGKSLEHYVIKHWCDLYSFPYGAISGDVANADRISTMAAFNSGRLPLLLVTRAGSEGVSYTRACTSGSWSVNVCPSVENQTMARLDRRGQAHRCKFVRLMMNTAVQRQQMEDFEYRSGLLSAFEDGNATRIYEAAHLPISVQLQLTTAPTPGAPQCLSVRATYASEQGYNYPCERCGIGACRKGIDFMFVFEGAVQHICWTAPGCCCVDLPGSMAAYFNTSSNFMLHVLNVKIDHVYRCSTTDADGTSCGVQFTVDPLNPDLHRLHCQMQLAAQQHQTSSLQQQYPDAGLLEGAAGLLPSLRERLQEQYGEITTREAFTTMLRQLLQSDTDTSLDRALFTSNVDLPYVPANQVIAELNAALTIFYDGHAPSTTENTTAVNGSAFVMNNNNDGTNLSRASELSPHAHLLKNLYGPPVQHVPYIAFPCNGMSHDLVRRCLGNPLANFTLAITQRNAHSFFNQDYWLDMSEQNNIVEDAPSSAPSPVGPGASSASVASEWIGPPTIHLVVMMDEDTGVESIRHIRPQDIRGNIDTYFQFFLCDNPSRCSTFRYCDRGDKKVPCPRGHERIFAAQLSSMIGNALLAFCVFACSGLSTLNNNNNKLTTRELNLVNATIRMVHGLLYVMCPEAVVHNEFGVLLLKAYGAKLLQELVVDARETVRTLSFTRFRSGCHGGPTSSQSDRKRVACMSIPPLTCPGEPVPFNAPEFRLINRPAVPIETTRQLWLDAGGPSQVQDQALRDAEHAIAFDIDKLIIRHLFPTDDPKHAGGKGSGMKLAEFMTGHMLGHVWVSDLVACYHPPEVLDDVVELVEGYMLTLRDSRKTSDSDYNRYSAALSYLEYWKEVRSNIRSKKNKPWERSSLLILRGSCITLAGGRTQLLVFVNALDRTGDEPILQLTRRFTAHMMGAHPDFAFKELSGTLLCAIMGRDFVATVAIDMLVLCVEVLCHRLTQNGNCLLADRISEEMRSLFGCAGASGLPPHFPKVERYVPRCDFIVQDINCIVRGANVLSRSYAEFNNMQTTGMIEPVQTCWAKDGIQFNGYRWLINPPGDRTNRALLEQLQCVGGELDRRGLAGYKKPLKDLKGRRFDPDIHLTSAWQNMFSFKFASMQKAAFIVHRKPVFQLATLPSQHSKDAVASDNVTLPSFVSRLALGATAMVGSILLPCSSATSPLVEIVDHAPSGSAVTSPGGIIDDMKDVITIVRDPGMLQPKKIRITCSGQPLALITTLDKDRKIRQLYAMDHAALQRFRAKGRVQRASPYQLQSAKYASVLGPELCATVVKNQGYVWVGQQLSSESELFNRIAGGACPPYTEPYKNHTIKDMTVVYGGGVVNIHSLCPCHDSSMIGEYGAPGLIWADEYERFMELQMQSGQPRRRCVVEIDMVGIPIKSEDSPIYPGLDFNTLVLPDGVGFILPNNSPLDKKKKGKASVAAPPLYEGSPHPQAGPPNSVWEDGIQEYSEQLLKKGEVKCLNQPVLHTGLPNSERDCPGCLVIPGFEHSFKCLEFSREIQRISCSSRSCQGLPGEERFGDLVLSRASVLPPGLKKQQLKTYNMTEEQVDEWVSRCLHNMIENGRVQNGELIQQKVEKHCHDPTGLYWAQAYQIRDIFPVEVVVWLRRLPIVRRWPMAKLLRPDGLSWHTYFSAAHQVTHNNAGTDPGQQITRPGTIQDFPEATLLGEVFAQHVVKRLEGSTNDMTVPNYCFDAGQRKELEERIKVDFSNKLYALFYGSAQDHMEPHHHSKLKDRKATKYGMIVGYTCYPEGSKPMKMKLRPRYKDRDPLNLEDSEPIILENNAIFTFNFMQFQELYTHEIIGEDEDAYSGRMCIVVQI